MLNSHTRETVYNQREWWYSTIIVCLLFKRTNFIEVRDLSTESAAINTASKYALGIDIGGTKTVFALTDLNGDVVAYQKSPSHREGLSPLENIKIEAKKFLSSCGFEQSEIVGTGIGVPGVVDYKTGVVASAPALSWTDINIKAAFESFLPGPVYVDNDVNMGVIGEKWKGSGRAHGDVVFIAVGTGIGAGLVLNGSVHRGSGGYAGEIGYLPVDPLTTEQTRFEDFGALEKFASGSGIVLQARALAEQHPDSSIRDANTITSEEIFAAAASGDVLAERLVDLLIKHTAYALSSVVALINPDVIVIGGGVAQAGDRLFEGIQDRVSQLVPIPVSIVPAGLGSDAGAIGAALAALIETNNMHVKEV